MVAQKKSRNVLSMARISIGGVPEHYNLPWQLAAERDIFSSAGLDISWTVYAGGTGAMTAALNAGELDLAILLTEGFISAVHHGLRARLAKVYIETPLPWGIYAGVDSMHTEVNFSLPNKFAVSRLGSGSHLMPSIHALDCGTQLKDEQFDVVNSLPGAAERLKAGVSNFFYWEQYMARPFVQSGHFRQVGKFAAPWSSFLVVMSEDALEKKKESVLRLLQIMAEECIRFKQDNASVIHLSKRFEMTISEAREWLQYNQWNLGLEVDLRSISLAAEAIGKLMSTRIQIDHHKIFAPWVKWRE